MSAAGWHSYFSSSPSIFASRGSQHRATCLHLIGSYLINLCVWPLSAAAAHAANPIPMDFYLMDRISCSHHRRTSADAITFILLNQHQSLYRPAHSHAASLPLRKVTTLHDICSGLYVKASTVSMAQLTVQESWQLASDHRQSASLAVWARTHRCSCRGQSHQTQFPARRSPSNFLFSL